MEERQVKQVIVFRKDLRKGEHAVRLGKVIAQCCHASLGALLKMFNKIPTYSEKDNEGNCEVDSVEYSVKFQPNSVLDKWLNERFTKICLYVNNDEELVALYEKIKMKIQISHVR